MKNKFKFSEGLKKYTMVIVLLVVVILFTVNTGGKMLLPQNVNNLIAQNAYVFILATGMLFCILTGGNIDLSVGSLVCFIGAIGGTMMITFGINPYLSLLAMAIIGVLAGAWQGFWIAYVRIPPFIVTLAGMLMFRGLSNVVLQGMTLSPIPNPFLSLFNSYVPDIFGMEGFNLTCFLIGIIACLVFIVLELLGRRRRQQKGYHVDPLLGTIIKLSLISIVILAFMYKLAMYKGIPNALIWVTVIIGIYSYITSKTTTGRYFYAVGGNEKATRLSGIDTNKVYFLAYLNMGFLAAVAGMITVARLNSANPTAGNNYEMDEGDKCVVIFHDYEGICHHATGFWERKEQSSVEYYEKMNKLMSQGIQVIFVKVDSHTGDFFNELVDEKCKEKLLIASDKVVEKWLLTNCVNVSDERVKQQIVNIAPKGEENIIIINSNEKKVENNTKENQFSIIISEYDKDPEYAKSLICSLSSKEKNDFIVYLLDKNN